MLCLLIQDKRHLRSVPASFFTVGSVTFYTYLSSSLPGSLATLADQKKFIRVMNILLVPAFRIRLVFSLSPNASSFPAKIP